MKYFKGFYMALGMFIGIPLPFHFWEEKYAPLMVASIPLVGLVVGGLWWLAALGLLALNFPIILAAALMAMAPFFIAGFIHLDGYMDTSDAILSYRPLEDKMRILKDPNVGAFAVVMLGILFVLQFAAMHPVAENGRFLALLIPISVISRSCSAMSVLTLRHMPGSNYIPILSQGIRVSHKLFIVLVALTTIALSFFYAGFSGIIVSLAVVLGYACGMRFAYKSLNGVSGDLLGYSLVIGELFGLVALAVMQ